MVNIPKGEWLCSACSGRSNEQVSFKEYAKEMLGNDQEILKFLGLPFKKPRDFFRNHSNAIELFSLNSQAAVKQYAVNNKVQAKNICFDVDGVKFLRAPVKNDWILPTPMLTEKEYVSYRTTVVDRFALFIFDS